MEGRNQEWNVSRHELQVHSFCQWLRSYCEDLKGWIQAVKMMQAKAYSEAS